MKKKVISVVLAAAMLCAILTAFSSASEDAGYFCPLCGATMGRVDYRVSYSDFGVSSCGYVNTSHTHYNTVYTTVYACYTPNCSLRGVSQTDTSYDNNVCGVMHPHP